MTPQATRVLIIAIIQQWGFRVVLIGDITTTT